MDFYEVRNIVNYERHFVPQDHFEQFKAQRAGEVFEIISTKNPAAVALGSIKSDKKAKASRENGKKGGRPKTLHFCRRCEEEAIITDEIDGYCDSCLGR
jgi:hypothetical protein